ncbi:MAG: AAA family ATPase, partial [Caldimonas sp.]
DAAASDAQVVIADTTALMIAVYSELVFGDTSLYAMAEEAQRRCDLSLVTALDLPWQADGLQRDGAHVRTPVDELVRAALARSGVGAGTIAGTGPARLHSALAVIDDALAVGSR